MKYNYYFVDTYAKDEARAALKDLAKKNKETKLPELVVHSHEEMVAHLRRVSEGNSAIDQRALNAIEKYDRTNFFDWNDVPEHIKEKVVTPYCFMAPIFSEGQTIPSAHFILGQASFLDLHGDELDILEIGGGTGYNAAIIAATAGSDATVYSSEIRPNLVKLAQENIKKVNLQSRVRIRQAHQNVLGFPAMLFNRIYSTVAAHTTDQVETLLDQLVEDEESLLMLPIAKYGNVQDKTQAKLWEPGMDIDKKDIYFSDPARGFIRQATYTFKKIDRENIEYSLTISNALGPLFS